MAADPVVNFGPYDNDGNGYVDAFIVVHAGPGAEVTGSTGDIWSHKWVLPSVYNADGTQIYGYLTIPEDARIGVCCHELGHLLFGWPDLYDTDYSSAGIGNWCLMAGGSWGGNGDVPCHPSAWCKVNQGWVTVSAPTSNVSLTISDVESSKQVYRLWKDGGPGNEYFLVENRQHVGYDQSLPGSGLLVWHVDDAVAGNTNEAHPKVALLQADGNQDMEHNHNRGDTGDPYPGSSSNTSLTKSSTPNTLSYAGSDTCVSLTSISPSGPSMTARVTVSCAVVKRVSKEIAKEALKEKEHGKEIWSDHKNKEHNKEVKDFKDFHEVDWPWRKLLTDTGRFGRGRPAAWQFAGGGQGAGGGGAPDEPDQAGLESRVTMLEMLLASVLESFSGGPGGQSSGDPARAFIGPEERPDLSGSALAGEDDQQHLRDAMAQGGVEAAHAKRQFDHGQGR